MRTFEGLAVFELVLAQQGYHLAQLIEGLVRTSADYARRQRQLLGRGVGTELHRSRISGQQRKPVSQHVVHFAGDAGPLQGPGLGHPPVLFRFRPLGPLT